MSNYIKSITFELNICVEPTAAVPISARQLPAAAHRCGSRRHPGRQCLPRPVRFPRQSSAGRASARPTSTASTATAASAPTATAATTAAAASSATARRSNITQLVEHLWLIAAISLSLSPFPFDSRFTYIIYNTVCFSPFFFIKRYRFVFRKIAVAAASCPAELVCSVSRSVFDYSFHGCFIKLASHLVS